MKKIISAVILVFSFYNITTAQTQLLDTFYLSATNSIYGIYADVDVSGSLSVFFDMEAPNDNQRVQCEIPIRYNLNPFIQSLNKACVKYKEWTEIIQEESGTMISKKIPVSFFDQSVYFTQDGKWYKESGVDIRAMFRVDKQGMCLLSIETDYMTSEENVARTTTYGSYASLIGSNQWIWGGLYGSGKITQEKYCGGASLTFSSIEEVEIFIKKLKDVAQWKLNQNKTGSKLR